MMSKGIDAGLLQNAVPLSAERIKELERQAIVENRAFVYLNEKCEVCFALPNSPHGVRELAWHNAFELAAESSGLLKKVYKKSPVDGYCLVGAFIKIDHDDAWEMTNDFYRQLVCHLEQNSVAYLETILVEELEK